MTVINQDLGSHERHSSSTILACPFLTAASASTSYQTDIEHHKIIGQLSKAFTADRCPWRHKYGRPPGTKDIKLTRRQLRKLNKTWSMEEVKQHKYADDAWIVVDGKVYDITEHILTHPGWNSAGISTVLSIVSHIGIDCSTEFHEIHRPYPVAWKQLRAFYIGDLQQEYEVPSSKL